MVLIVTAVGTGLAEPASAHGEKGIITITALTPTGTSVRIEAGVVYENDNDLAEGATVTADLRGPAGAVVGPVPLARQQGSLYAGDVEVPTAGSWSVIVRSTTPTAEAQGSVEVAGTASTTATTSATTSVTSTASTIASTSTPLPVATSPAGPTAVDAGPVKEESTFPWALVVIVLVAVAIGAAAAVRFRPKDSDATEES